MNFQVDGFSTNLTTEIQMESILVKTEPHQDAGNVFIKQEFFVNEPLTVKDETKKECEDDTSSEEEQVSCFKNYETQLRDLIGNIQGTIKCHDSHLKLASMKSKYKCEICNKGCSRFSSIKRHLVSHLDPQNFVHLKQHKPTVHQGQKPHQCDVCSKQFGRKSYLNKHKLTVHQGQKPHQCDVCSKQFGHKSHLNKHKLTVHHV